MKIAIYRRSNQSRRVRVGIPVVTALCVLGGTASAEPAYETSAKPVYDLLDVATTGFGSLNAREINEDGQAIASGSFQQGFFWDGMTLRRADTDESLLAGINDSGLVVGGIERGFIWDGIGELVRLGSVEPFIPFSTPVDINNRGQVVGAASSNFGDLLPFLWEDGTIRELPGLGGDRGRASAINEFGQVAGSAETNGGLEHAFLWDGETHDLGSLGGSRISVAAINNLGQVVGRADTADGSSHAFLWDGRKMYDLGTLGGAASAAAAINDEGQVIGNADTADGHSHAFLWDGKMHDLGTLGGGTSRARAINRLGQVVGNAETEEGTTHAFLWNGSMHDLNDLIDPSDPLEPVVILANAGDINSRGQIVANGSDTSDTSNPPPREHMYIVSLIDADGDGIRDGEDNCPTVANPYQADKNGDGFGDECVHPTAKIAFDAEVDPTVIIDAYARVGRGAVIGARSEIGSSTLLRQGVAIGSDVRIGTQSVVKLETHVGDGSRIGDYVVIGQGAMIFANVTIGDATLIGQAALICPGADIGKGARIGQQALVRTNATVPAGGAVRGRKDPPSFADCALPAE